MNVLHVISDENIGGAGILLLNLLSSLKDECINSTVALPERSRLLARIKGLNVPTIPLKKPCDRVSVGSVLELCEHIRDRGIDVVHTNSALAARIAGRLCGVRVIHTRHCCFPPTGIWKIPMVRTVGGIFNRILSDRAIATASEAKDNLEALGFPSERIDVIINGSRSMRRAAEGELESL